MILMIEYLVQLYYINVIQLIYMFPIHLHILVNIIFCIYLLILFLAKNNLIIYSYLLKISAVFFIILVTYNKSVNDTFDFTSFPGIYKLFKIFTFNNDSIDIFIS